MNHFLRKFLIVIAFICVFYSFFRPNSAVAQSSNYWARNFNEESSLLSGAVVGGDAGPAAIFYNPAGISQIAESKLSINASLFSMEYFKASNTWGEDKNMKDVRFVVVPKFVSYMLKPKNNPNWDFEFAILNNENFKLEDNGSVNDEIDILSNSPGEERYNVVYEYNNKYRDDWLGAGTSYQVSPDLMIGASMFVSARSVRYSYVLDIEAVPKFSVGNPESYLSFTARSSNFEHIKFNNYRLLWKLGMLYAQDNLSFGLNITTPSINVYADGKSITRKKSQSNISNPETQEAIPNYLISDYAEKKAVKVNYKSPLSIAGGITWRNAQNTKTVYLTMEYFTGQEPSRLISSSSSNDFISGNPELDEMRSDWLTYVWGAKQVFNTAVGYRWIINENLKLLTGFRTDFNYRKNYDYYPYLERKTFKGFTLNRYHLTGGVTARVLGQDLMAGLQYTLGKQDNQKQFANLTDPVEYNPQTLTALQGIRNNSMSSVLTSISLYFGATFNFGEQSK